MEMWCVNGMYKLKLVSRENIQGLKGSKMNLFAIAFRSRLSHVLHNGNG